MLFLKRVKRTSLVEFYYESNISDLTKYNLLGDTFYSDHLNSKFIFLFKAF